MNTARIATIAAVCLCAGAAFAGKGAPIVPVENVTLQTTSKAAAETAIRQGAARRGWIPEVVSEDLVRCTLNVRGHSLTVDVPHTENSFSVRYAASVNLNYDAATGTIHRKYNGWVANLVKDIQMAAVNADIVATTVAPASAAPAEAAPATTEEPAPAQAQPESDGARIGRAARGAVADVADAISGAVRGHENGNAQDETSAEARLKKLDELKAKGLITDEEFATRRKEIIDSL